MGLWLAGRVVGDGVPSPATGLPSMGPFSRSLAPPIALSRARSLSSIDPPPFLPERRGGGFETVEVAVSLLMTGTICVAQSLLFTGTVCVPSSLLPGASVIVDRLFTFGPGGVGGGIWSTSPRFRSTSFLSAFSVLYLQKSAKFADLMDSV